MSYLSVGDMAQAYQMRRHNAGLQGELMRLSEELTSGVQADLSAAVSGDFKALAGLDQTLRVLDAFKTSTAEADLFTGSLQFALDTVQSAAEELSPSLLMASSSSSATLVGSISGETRQKFEAVVSALNTQVADRYLLSGNATDQKPLGSAQDILDALMLAAAGQVTPAGIDSTITAWFDAPAGGGGFVDMIYGGSNQPLAAFLVGPADSVQLDTMATDPALRDLLKGFALGALVSEGILPGDVAGQAEILKSSGETLLGAVDLLAGLRAEVGTVEAHIADAAFRNEAQRSALTIARNEIIAADPYDTASALEAVQTQIETLYTLTARLSRLSLADYLR
jgi:flagellar hook-associated protein 3 FlgL